MKRTIFTLLTVATTSFSAYSQNIVTYHGIEYETQSDLGADNPTLTIIPVDEKRLKENNGVIEVTVDGHNVKYDGFASGYVKPTEKLILVRYEILDSAKYEMAMDSKAVYIYEQYGTIKSILKDLENYEALIDQTPSTQSQKYLLDVLAENGVSSEDDKLKSAARKSVEKYKFQKKLLPIIPTVTSLLKEELQQWDNILDLRNDWEKFLNEPLPKSNVYAIAHNLDDQKGLYSWTSKIGKLKTKTIQKRIANPLLLSAIEIPNPNYNADYFEHVCADWRHSFFVPRIFESNNSTNRDVTHYFVKKDNSRIQIKTTFKHTVDYYGSDVLFMEFKKTIPVFEGEIDKKGIKDYTKDNYCRIDGTVKFKDSSIPYSFSRFCVMGSGSSIAYFEFRYPTEEQELYNEYMDYIINSVRLW